MQPLPVEMAHAVFRPTVPNKPRKFECTSYMLRILMALDGQSDLATVAKKSGLSIKEAISTVIQLKRAGLVQVAAGSSTSLGEEFFTFLQKQLSVVVGPIAEILIEDAVKDLGHDRENLPAFKAAELVALLAKDIQNEEKRISFQKIMVDRIKQG